MAPANALPAEAKVTTDSYTLPPSKIFTLHYKQYPKNITTLPFHKLLFGEL